jgi:hypothetical protein
MSSFIGSVFTLNAIMMSVIMMNVVMLGVATPKQIAYLHYQTSRKVMN